ncbi:histidine kinase [Streptomyces sp. DSM 42041]|uniref:histidine kinase n=1 Tax=Streptomyces hazeniae TaxID=3075538 RepID=A0ABU2NS04_9ACTN|nr:histidine kinase [Streptomyces sp. DSM 42041]MDT0379769.1 histidine kinase [Streptomyces sp. DSM 42041]
MNAHGAAGFRGTREVPDARETSGTRENFDAGDGTAADEVRAGDQRRAGDAPAQGGGRLRRAVRAPLTALRWMRRGWLTDAVVAVLASLDVYFSLPTPHLWQTVLSWVAAGALLLRRRWPRLTLALALPGLYAGVALLASIVALGTLASRCRVAWQVRLAVVAVVTGSFIPWPLSRFAEAEPGLLVQNLIYALVLGVGPAVIGLLVQTRQDLSARVAELATVRDHERELHARTVLAREHARLAREMHDVVSHKASLMAVQAGALEVTAADPEVKEAAGTLRRLATGTLEELRGMIVVLRAAGAGPTELLPQPRLGNLPELVEGSGLDAELRMDGADGRRLPEAVERTAYRTVQEALTNVRKHAPGARTLVTVDVDDEALRVSIRNGPPDGAAPRPDIPGGGHGIVGLQERAVLLGGRLTFGPTPEGGYAVRAEVPLERPAKHASAH